MATSKGYDSLKTEYVQSTVTVNGSGAGTAVITFETDFVSTPSILVVANEADAAGGASYTAASATKDGFTLTVTGSTRHSQDITVIWFAHQKD